ncbi:MAG: hypothetical protein F6K04_23595 [Leptolyngbya sp. SIO4C5]|nr:hypothetical protein [Leptolyngbya sp. SIO4C5]
MKVRGFRIELGEVEAAMAEHPRLQQGVVVAVADQQGGQRLVAYGVAAEGGVSSRELRRFLRERLPEYMVPSVFVPLAALPLLPNGKLDRRALPLPETLASSPGTVPEVPLTQTEELLAAVWSELLAVAVGRHDNFFELGGHSLLAIRAIARLREVFAFNLPLSKCFELPTIAELGQYIDAEHKGGQPGAFAIQPRPRGSELPLSFAQERLWFLDQLEANSAAYNVPAAVQLVGHLDVAALQQAVAEIVRRHESLRTTFPTVQGRPIQAIAADLPITIPVVDLQDLPAQMQSSQVKQRAMAEAQRPFDLACGPLLRLSLLRLAADVYVLLINLHHIVSDGWSRRVVFVRELAALYEAFAQNAPSPLPELPVQYADFAQWQRQWLSGEVLTTQLDYWRQELADPLPVLDLPTDRSRPSVQTFRGAHSCFSLSADLTQKLKALSQQSGTTLFMTLLAAFAALLSRYSDQSDIAIGSPIANRDRSELEPLIGLFLNTLVFRIDLQGNPPFLELLTRVRQKTLGAYAHQDIPFEKLMSELQTTRQLSHSPWFQVMFILQNLPSEKLELSGLTLTLLEQEGWANATAKFDLTLIMEEKGPQLEGIFEYNTDLFEAATIGRLVEHFQNLLAGIAASPHQRLSDLPMLSAAEQQQLLEGRYASAYSEALTEDDSQALPMPDEDIDRLIAELAELSETEAQQLLSDAS